MSKRTPLDVSKLAPVALRPVTDEQIREVAMLLADLIMPTPNMLWFGGENSGITKHAAGPKATSSVKSGSCGLRAGRHTQDYATQTTEGGGE